jgi:hypothetical protein
MWKRRSDVPNARSAPEMIVPQEKPGLLVVITDQEAL